MESAGTPLGGGALKLEATHIRQVPIPPLSDWDCERLAELGKQMAAAVPSARHRIDMFILAAALPGCDENDLKEVTRDIDTRLEAMCAARQRTVHGS